MIKLTMSYLFSMELKAAENVRLSHCIDEMRKKAQMLVHTHTYCRAPLLCRVVCFLHKNNELDVTWGRHGEDFDVKMIKVIKLICWPRSMCLMLEENNPYLVCLQSAYARKMPHKPR